MKLSEVLYSIKPQLSIKHGTVVRHRTSGQHYLVLDVANSQYKKCLLLNARTRAIEGDGLYEFRYTSDHYDIIGEVSPIVIE